MEPNNPNHDDTVTCARCGAIIPRQSAIERDGQLICTDCLMKEVKHDVAEAEAITEERRRVDLDKQLNDMRRQRYRRTLILLLCCIIIWFAAIEFVKLNKSEPVPHQSIDAAENLDIAKSLLNIAIYKYQKDHKQTPPKDLKQLIPAYLEARHTPLFKYFSYTTTKEGEYFLEIKSSEKQESAATEINGADTTEEAQ